MKKGLALFWFGVVFMILVAGLGGWGSPPAVVRVSEVTGMIAFFLWAFSVPIGVLIAGTGLFKYANVKKKNIVFYLIGISLVVFLVDMVLRMYLVRTDGHVPALFGLGGCLMLILSSCLLWFWGKNRERLKGVEAKAADLRFVGYAFFLIATWFLCGAFGAQFSEGLSKWTPRSPINIIIYLVLGWFFHMLSYKVSAQSKK